MKKEIFQTYDPKQRKHVTIDPANLIAGERFTKLFWCKSAKRYITIPGASGFIVADDGSYAID